VNAPIPPSCWSLPSLRLRPTPPLTLPLTLSLTLSPPPCHQVTGQWMTKLEALVRRLLLRKRTSPGEKTLVFSQWPVSEGRRQGRVSAYTLRRDSRTPTHACASTAKPAHGHAHIRSWPRTQPHSSNASLHPSSFLSPLPPTRLRACFQPALSFLQCPPRTTLLLEPLFTPCRLPLSPTPPRPTTTTIYTGRPASGGQGAGREWATPRVAARVGQRARRRAPRHQRL
jgi:hypothetical protein